MDISREAGAVAVSALTTRVTGGTGAAVPPSVFNWDESQNVIRLKQPDTFDASELLFVGLRSEPNSESHAPAITCITARSVSIPSKGDKYLA
jgi:hypothetical protein